MALTGVKGLQRWCQIQLEGYPGVEITNMTKSWRNGLAFCALIHRYRPDLIDFNSLKASDVLSNNQLAFDVADRELGVAPLLDAEDMVALAVPDRLSICTYVSQFYNVCNGMKPLGGMGNISVNANTNRNDLPNANDAPKAKSNSSTALISNSTPGGRSGSAALPAKPADPPVKRPAANEGAGAGKVSPQKRGPARPVSVVPPKVTPYQSSPPPTSSTKTAAQRQASEPKATSGVVSPPSGKREPAVGKTAAGDDNASKRSGASAHLRNVLPGATSGGSSASPVAASRGRSDKPTAARDPAGKSASPPDSRSSAAPSASSSSSKSEAQPVAQPRHSRVASPGRGPSASPRHKGPSVDAGPGASSRMSTAVVCHLCNMSVALIGRITIEGVIMHRQCFCCSECGCQLREPGYHIFGDRFFCERDYRLEVRVTKAPTLRRGIVLPSEAPTPAPPAAAAASTARLQPTDTYSVVDKPAGAARKGTQSSPAPPATAAATSAAPQPTDTYSVVDKPAGAARKCTQSASKTEPAGPTAPGPDDTYDRLDRAPRAEARKAKDTEARKAKDAEPRAQSSFFVASSGSSAPPTEVPKEQSRFFSGDSAAPKVPKPRANSRFFTAASESAAPAEPPKPGKASRFFNGNSAPRAAAPAAAAAAAPEKPKAQQQSRFFSKDSTTAAAPAPAEQPKTSSQFFSGTSASEPAAPKVASEPAAPKAAPAPSAPKERAAEQSAQPKRPAPPRPSKQPPLQAAVPEKEKDKENKKENAKEAAAAAAAAAADKPVKRRAPTASTPAASPATPSAAGPPPKPTSPPSRHHAKGQAPPPPKPLPPQELRRKRKAPTIPRGVQKWFTGDRVLADEQRLTLVEVDHQLAGLDNQQKALEAEGLALENRLREATPENEDRLMEKWFALIEKKNDLVSQEGELVYQQRDLTLIQQRKDLEKDIRVRMEKDPSKKSKSEVAEENALIEELVEVVDERNHLLNMLDVERLQEQEEHDQFAAALPAGAEFSTEDIKKGRRWSILKKGKK